MSPKHAATSAADSEHASSLLAVATIILTLLGWASVPLFLAYFAEREIDYWTVNGWRYAISALIWAPMLVIGYRNGTLTRALWKAALIPSIFNAVAQVAFAIAPYYVKPGVMTFSLRLQIVFVTVGAAVLFASERRVIRTPGFLFGLALVTFGTAGTILLRPGGLEPATAFGVFLAVSAGLLYACYALAVRHSMRGVNPLLAFAVISQYTAAALLPLMFMFGERSGFHVVTFPAFDLWMLVISSVVGIGLGHTFYYISIARLGVAVSAGVIQLQPVLVAAASMYLFAEPFTAQQWGSGAVAVFGAGVILWVQHRMSRRKDPVSGFRNFPVDVDAAAAIAERDRMNAGGQLSQPNTPRA